MNYTKQIDVSVIVPVYNSRQTIEKCLNSFIKQTYKNFELICVDDGSTDESLNILNEYAKTYSFIKVLSQKNSGCMVARNYALKESCGKYIMFCDSDDWYELNMIEEMVNAMNTYNPDIVMCDCNVIDLSNNKYHKKSDIKWCYLKYKGFVNLNSKIKNEINTVIWNKLFKKDLLNMYNITYPTKYEHDDTIFFWKYILASTTYYGIDKKLYNYVIGKPNSISAKYRIKKESPHQLDFIFSLQEIFDFIKNSNFENDYRVYISHSLSIIKFFYKFLSKKVRKKAFKCIKNLVKKNIDFLKLYEEDYYYIYKIRKFKTFEKYVFNNIKEKESLLEGIFSVKKENQREIITILGLRIKVKNIK